MTDQWREYKVSADASHHIHQGRPAYQSRFDEVLKFHEPGLAPVHDASGAYHITPDGLAAYAPRYIRTFGFYEGRAAVHAKDGWFHVLGDGSPLYGERYAWCGNFQEGRCPVRLPGGDYFHITRRWFSGIWRRAIGTPATSGTATLWSSGTTANTPI